MPALILYGLEKPCDRNGYPVVGKPTKISPWWTLCACPSCKPATDTLVKKMESQGKVEQFTIRARNEREAVQEGRRLSLWAKAQVKSEGRTPPEESRRKRHAMQCTQGPRSQSTDSPQSSPPPE